MNLGFTMLKLLQFKEWFINVLNDTYDTIPKK